MARSVEELAREPESGSPAGTQVVAQVSADSASAVAGWQTLLSGSPREVLARLVRDDPLEVRARVATRLRADALLLDGDRVHLRVLARISRASASYRGRPELSDWIDGAVAGSIEELVREEHESARSRSAGRSDRVRERSSPSALATASPGTDAFTTLAAPLGLDPRSMRDACAAFDVLPFADRNAFFDLVLEAGDLDVAARAAGVSASEIARRARRALDAILAAALGAGADSEKGRKR
jgi:hypothetical protein